MGDSLSYLDNLVLRVNALGQTEGCFWKVSQLYGNARAMIICKGNDIAHTEGGSQWG